MTTVSLSSTPLTTLLPNSSPQKNPNYNNAFSVNLPSLSQNTSSLNSNNFANKVVQDFTNKMNPSINLAQLRGGLTLSKSNNIITALYGQDMVQDAQNKLSDLNSSRSSIFPTDSTGKLSFNEKFANSTFGKNYGTWSSGLNTANTLFTGLFGEKSEYDGEKGDVTRSIDSVYDTIQNFAGTIPGVGQAISLGMGANKLLGNVVNKLGGGTDGMTNIDSILGSSFLSLTPFGLINGFGGKRADTITKNDEVFEQVGSSYTGSESNVDDALTKSGKKYGLFSSGARKEANRQIAEAKRQQSIIEDIADEATDRFAIRDSMAAINGNRRKYYLQGGYNQADVRVGRSGMSLDLIAKSKKILGETRQLKNGGKVTPTEILLVVPEFQEGGQINKKDNSIIYARQRFPILKSIEVNLQYDPNFRPREIGNFGDIEYMTSEHDDLPYYRNYKKEDQFKGKPTIVYNDNVDDEDIALDMLSHGLREQDENWKSYFLPNLENDWKQYIIDELFTSTLPISLDKFKNLSDKDKQRYFRQFDDNFKLGKYNEQYNSILDGLVRALSVKDEFRQSKGYNYPQDILNNLRNTNAWKQAYDYINSNLLPEIIVKHQEGGSINVIPEGALHAHKHNMDMEGITPKGIPVVSNKEGGEVEQQAEIEREEIIFRLEVTKKLEELEKKFYDSETSQKEKDECALEAGKLLVEEILYNTQDNTNSLL